MAFETYTIDKTVPIPLYYQLKQILLDEINSGTLKEGDIIPTELDFAQLYNISRTTIRQAITELVSEGYLYRKKGTGTFVSKPKINQDFIRKIETFNDEMRRKGLKPSTKVLKLELIDADFEAAKKLHLSPGEKVIQLNRLRFADNDPIVYIETLLPYQLCKAVFHRDLVTESLYDILSESENTKVKKVIRSVEAVLSEPQDASLLNIETGAPVQRIEFISYSSEGIPVEYSISRYSGAKNRFTVELILE